MSKMEQNAEEVYLQVETWDGMPVRIPLKDLERWSKGQEMQKKLAQQGKQLTPSADFTRKMLKLMGKPKK